MLGFYLSLTLKNLLRRKRRTLLTAAAIAVGILYFVAFDSMLSGLNQEAVSNMISFETGHVQLTAPVGTPAPSVEAVLADVRSQADVVGATPRFVVPAMLVAEADELPVSVVAVDPKSDTQVFKQAHYVTEGQWLTDGTMIGAPDTIEEPTATAPISIVLGQRIAELLGLTVGDSVGIRLNDATAMATATVGAPPAAATVTGIVNTPHPTVNSSQIFVAVGRARELVDAAGVSPSTVVSVSVAPRRTRDPIRIVASIGTIAGWKVESWNDTATFLAIGSGKRTYAMALLGLVMIIATIGVVNSILLSTMERTREIGILMSIGMTRSQIVTLFVMEGGGLGLLGGLLGAVMSVATNYYLVEVGIDIQSILGDIDLDIGYPIATAMRGAWNWPMLIVAVLFGLAVSLIASYLPARRAAGLDPVACLRRL